MQITTRSTCVVIKASYFLRILEIAKQKNPLESVHLENDLTLDNLQSIIPTHTHRFPLSKQSDHITYSSDIIVSIALLSQFIKHVFITCKLFNFIVKIFITFILLSSSPL